MIIRSRQLWLRAALILSILLYACALWAPAVTVEQQPPLRSSGAWVLLQGWRGIPLGYVEWLANPLLLLCWIAAWRSSLRLCAAFGLVTLVLMLVPCAHLVFFGSRFGGHRLQLEPGYFLWVACDLCMLGAAGCGLPAERKLQILGYRGRARQESR